MSAEKNDAMGFHIQSVQTDEQKLNSSSEAKSKSMKTSFKSCALSTATP